MKSVRRHSPETIVLALFTAGVALPSLVNAWRHSPYDRAGSVAFFLWIIPACVLLMRGSAAWPLRLLRWVGLALLAGGTLTDVHALRHAALACSVASLLPWDRRTMGWLALAVCWLPALGWFSHFLPPVLVGALRIGLAVTAGAILSAPCRRSTAVTS